jgi:hypothetical protein
MEEQSGLVPVSVGFLLGLLSEPKEGGDRFLRNVGFSPSYKASQARRPSSSESSLGNFGANRRI